MDIYSGDIFTAIFVLMGVVVMLKKEVTFMIAIGPSSTHGSVNIGSHYTKRKEIQLLGISKIIMAFLFIVFGVAIDYLFRGSVVFSI